MTVDAIRTARFSRPALRVLTALLAILTVHADRLPAEDHKAAAEYVLHISVDGLGSSYLQALIDAGEAPNFKRFQSEGAWTNNARTDFDYTITLPNHTSMVTGRPVMDRPGKDKSVAGHSWIVNTDPGDATLHSNRHAYVKSTFDVAHDHGLRTGLYASKTKFVLYDQSYDAATGAADTVGPDNGRDKIDVYLNQKNTADLVNRLVETMQERPLHYAFVHWHDCDTAGHMHAWGGRAYVAAVKAVDGYLGRIFEMIDRSPTLRGKTAIVLSADHGGTLLNHQENDEPRHYTIPFYVWGAGVARGKDLYALNSRTRREPGAGRPDYEDSAAQPIRNGDGGNLAMKLLGLPAVPGSTINASQDLKVSE